MGTRYSLEKSGILRSPHYKPHLFCFLNILCWRGMPPYRFSLGQRGSTPCSPLCKPSPVCPGLVHSSAAAEREWGTRKEFLIFSDFSDGPLCLRGVQEHCGLLRRAKQPRLESRWLMWLESLHCSLILKCQKIPQTASWWTSISGKKPQM